MDDLEDSIKETVMAGEVGDLGLGDSGLAVEQPQTQAQQQQQEEEEDGGDVLGEGGQEVLVIPAPPDGGMISEDDGNEDDAVVVVDSNNDQDELPDPQEQQDQVDSIATTTDEDEDEDKESDLDELIIDYPSDRPRTLPVEVDLPSFVMAIDVVIAGGTSNRRSLQQKLQQQETANVAKAEPVIDINALRIAVQSVIYSAVESLDERLWGITLQVKNVDAITVNKERTREFFSANGQAIFLVPEAMVEEEGSNNANDESMFPSLPGEEQIREAVATALQQESLMAEFAEAKMRSALPRATNVDVSFMDGTAVTGSQNYIDDEQPVSSNSTTEQVKAIFTPLTICIVAGVGGALALLIGSVGLISWRRGKSGKDGDLLTPRSRSFPDKSRGNSKFSFGDDPDPIRQTFSNDTHPISPESSAADAERDEKKKQTLNEYFEKIEDVESQPPSVGESMEYDASLYDESVCGMSTWSVNDIGKDHVQLTDKTTLKPDRSIASVGKRMRQALGENSAYAESEGDFSYAETDNNSTLGDFRLGSVLDVDDTNMSEYGGTMGGITEEISGEFTPEKSSKKASDFSALWKTRVEGEETTDPTVVDASPAKSIEDEVLGVSLSETNAAIKRLKNENKMMKDSNFLDVSHHAPRFGAGEDESDSEAEDAAMLFQERAPTIQEQDELNTSAVSGSSNAASDSGSNRSKSSARTGFGSIIGSILGKDEKQDQLGDTVGYLDNTIVNDPITNDTKGSGDKIIDDDVSDADTSVDMSSIADDVLHGQDTNLLSEAASSADAEEEPKFFQLDMPPTYKTKKDGEDEASVNDSEYEHSLYEM